MKRGEITISENKITIVPADGTIWLSDWQIAQLFEVYQAKVSSNIRSILKTEVLDERTVCRTYYYKDGGSVEQYNLEMITALAFRIKSYKAAVFREWLMRKAVTNTVGQQILKNIRWDSKALQN